MSNKAIVLIASLAFALNACTQPDDQFDYIEVTPVNITASPLNAKVGEAVEVTLVSDIGLDERSRVPERPISDIRLGVCFGYGLTDDGEGIVDPHGFCFKEVEALPSSYRLLDGTEYTKKFDDLVVRRGENYDFDHTFTFTLTEANVLALAPYLEFMDETFTGPSASGNVPKNYPVVTFE